MSLLARRLTAGSAVSGLGFITSFFRAILIVPFAIQAWGVKGYALWLQSIALIGLFQIAFVGMHTYTGVISSIEVGRGENKLSKILAQLLSLSIYFGCLIFIISTLPLIFPPLASLVFYGFDAGLIEKGAKILCILGLGALSTSITGTWARVFPAYGLFVKTQIWGIGNELMQVSVILVCAILRIDLFVTVIISTVMLIVLHFSSVILLKRAVPSLGKIFHFVGFRGLTQVIKNSYSFSVLQGATQVQQNMVIPICNGILGPEGAVFISISRTIANILFQGAAILLMPMMPEMGVLFGSDERRKLAKLVGISLLLLTSVTLIIATIVLYWWADILFFLGKGKVEGPLLAGTFMLAASSLSSVNLLLSHLSQLRQKHFSIMVLSVSELVCVITLVSLGAILGKALGVAAGLLITSLIVFTIGIQTSKIYDILKIIPFCKNKMLSIIYPPLVVLIILLSGLTISLTEVNSFFQFLLPPLMALFYVVLSIKTLSYIINLRFLWGYLTKGTNQS